MNIWDPENLSLPFCIASQGFEDLNLKASGQASRGAVGIHLNLSLIKERTFLQWDKYTQYMKTGGVGWTTGGSVPC